MEEPTLFRKNTKQRPVRGAEASERGRLVFIEERKKSPKRHVERNETKTTMNDQRLHLFASGILIFFHAIDV